MSPVSLDNARLAEVRQAVRNGRPTADGLVAAEGPHLLEEALRGNWRIHHIICHHAAHVRFGGLLKQVPAPVSSVSERAWKPLAGTQHSQGLLTLLEPHRWRIDDTVRGQPLLVILDAIQDPGNLGTIARSAEAFAATGLILGEGCARVSNGKVLRASSGSLFRLPFVEGLSRQAIAKFLDDQKIPLFVLAGCSALPISSVPWQQPCALLVGNEGAGASPEWQSAGRLVAIPTRGVESLNAAVACSITLFEAARQRTP